MHASAAKCSTSQRIVRQEAERKRHSGRGSASFDTSTWASMPSVGRAPWVRCAGAWVTPSWHLLKRQANFGHTVLAMHRHGPIELPPLRWQRGYPKPIVFGSDTVPPLFPPRAPSTRSGRSRYASSCTVPRRVGFETRGTAPPLLIETFVETPHYTGAVYRASGWTQVGTTDTERRSFNDAGAREPRILGPEGPLDPAYQASMMPGRASPGYPGPALPRTCTLSSFNDAGAREPRIPRSSASGQATSMGLQ